MAQLLIVILHNPDQVPDILKAWHDIGLPGATILNSVGGYRAKNWLDQVGLSGISQLFHAPGRQSKTLLSAIDDDELLEQAMSVVDQILGDLDLPHAGLYFTLPISYARGIIDQTEQSTKKDVDITGLPASTEPDDAIRITRKTPVSTVDKLFQLEPIIVSEDHTLIEVAEEMIKHPSAHVTCVVDDYNKLVGILPLRNLADDLFLDIVPEDFLTEVRDLEDVLHFVDLSRTNFAKDAMLPPAFVKETDTVRDAFHQMHQHKISGIPVVNERREVIGYINLLMLLALLAQTRRTSESSGE